MEDWIHKFTVIILIYTRISKSVYALKVKDKKIVVILDFTIFLCYNMFNIYLIYILQCRRKNTIIEGSEIRITLTQYFIVYSL